MSQKYLNQTGLPLSMAVYLATDHYDHKASETGFSVTTLLKPIKQVILGRRVDPVEALTDIIALTPSRIGTSIHTGVETAWLHHHKEAMASLGYPKGLIERVKVNPAKGSLQAGDIPVYLEVRSSRIVDGIKVTGMFDFVGDGKLEDIKTTGVYSYMAGNKDDDYCMQGSLYRWLNPEVVTKDVMAINFIFTDWSSASAKQQPDKYPQSRIVQKNYTLHSMEYTEQFVRDRIFTLMDLWDKPEDDLPPCSDKELWRSDPVYKYYKNPASNKPGGRSTKNFDSLGEANRKLYEDGNVGIVVTKPGEVKACKYCPAFPVCKQKDALIASGDLVM